MDTTTDVSPEPEQAVTPRRVHHAWVAAAEIPLRPGQVPGVARARAMTIETVVIIGVVDIYCNACRRSFSAARHTDCDVPGVPRGGPERGGPRPDRAEGPPDGLACTG